MRILLNCKLPLLPGHHGLLTPSNEQARKGVTVLSLVMDLDLGEVILSG